MHGYEHCKRPISRLSLSGERSSPDTLFLDVYIREVLRQFYFDGACVPDERLEEFAQTKWGPYQRYAGLYLTTDTDAWAKALGVSFRLRSAALSHPDR